MTTKWDEIKQRGNPSYKGKSVEPIDLFKEGGLLKSFALGCIIKYAYRSRLASHLHTIRDMKKIIHYAEMVIANEEEVDGHQTGRMSGERDCVQD